jgi:hypothetical protein
MQEQQHAGRAGRRDPHRRWDQAERRLARATARRNSRSWRERTPSPMTPIIAFTTSCGGARIERLETRLADVWRRWRNPEEPTTLGPPRGAGGRRCPHDGHRASRQGDYASAIWLQLGSALFGPAVWGPSGCWSGDHQASPPALRCEASTSRRVMEGRCRSNRARPTG